jgi:hypothetical protein
VIAATIVAFPLVFKAARAAFETVDPQLEHAARTLGISEWAVFFRVSLPLAWRGILAGLLLSFARALGEFGATLMVAGSIAGKTQTLSIAVYEAVQAGRDDTAGFLVAVTSITCISVLLAAGRLVPGAVMARGEEPAMIWEIALHKLLQHDHSRFEINVRFATSARRGRAVRSLGSRQDADAADDRRHHASERRSGGSGGTCALRPRCPAFAVAAAAQARLRVPGLRTVSAPDGAPEHRLRSAHRVAQSQATDRRPRRGSLDRRLPPGARGRPLPPSDLGGQRQRTALARALVTDPTALLLDEPFAALDKPLRESLRQELKELQAELGLPMLLITHDDDDVDSLGEQVVYLQSGHVTERIESVILKIA